MLQFNMDYQDGLAHQLLLVNGQYGYDWKAYTNQILEILEDNPWVNTYGAFAGLFNGFSSLSIGSITYTPSVDYNGTDTFTYKANDGSADSNTATVTITVSAVNDAPVANSSTFTTYRNSSSRTINLSATDVENDDLTYSVLNNPSNGTLGIINDGSSVSYTPSSDFTGSDSFTFKVNDGSLDSDASTINIGTHAFGETSLYFTRTSGTKDWLQVDTNIDFNSIFVGWHVTFSMWIKPEAPLDEYSSLVSRFSNENNYWSILLDANGDLF